MYLFSQYFYDMKGVGEIFDPFYSIVDFKIVISVILNTQSTQSIYLLIYLFNNSGFTLF